MAPSAAEPTRGTGRSAATTRALACTILVIAGAGMLPRPAAAQLADSAAVRRGAERAQARFETIRRANLPHAPTGGAARCEERIGRLCYWYDPDGPRPPAAESPRIADARSAMLEEFGAAAALHPGDGWIAGQRVRYLLERGDSAAAREAALACAAERWWCSALRGLTAHTSGATLEAEVAFADALAAAPSAVRCAWTDLGDILPEDAREPYRALACGAARDSANASIWWLAEPLQARPGQELRAEHHARLTRAELQRGSRTAYGLRWDDDLREILVRYGGSRWWSRGFPRPTETQPPITGHERTPSFHFLPAGTALRDPASAEPDHWDPDVPRARHRFAPPWARRFLPLPAQLGAFRRGDSTLIVAAWDASRDSVLGRATTRRWAALSSVAEPGAPVRADSTHDAASAGRLALTVAAAPGLTSLEMVATDSGATAARFRTMLAPPGDGALAVSVPLLLRAGSDDEPHAILADILHRVIGGDEVPAPGRLAVYWETYGIEPTGAAPVHVSLALHGGRRPWWRRAGDRLTGRTVAPPPTLAWADRLAPAAPPDSGASRELAPASFASRMVTIELPALAPGAYTLTVRIETADGSVAEATRPLRVRRR